MASQVTVLVWPEGRHLFETTRDERIAISDRDPDVLVFPCSQDRRLERLRATSLPAELRSARRFVFDGTAEATPAKPDIIASLESAIAELGLERSRCVYATANWHFAGDYAARSERPIRAVLGLRPGGVTPEAVRSRLCRGVPAGQDERA